MLKIIRGVQQFRSGGYEARRDLFQELAKGQHPSALLITCSDSRVCPNLLTQTEPGDLFVIRNAGNLVPPHSLTPGGEAATIEYAVRVLQVPDIIICGHAQCGAVQALLDPASATGLTAVASWLQYAEETRRRMNLKHAGATDPKQRLMAAVQENVLVQLDNLQTHPCVAEAAEQGKLELHGWTYDFAGGEVQVYDPQQEKFAPLEDPTEI